MNEIDGYLPRSLTPKLQVALATARVVNLDGPRQVGKTTLVRDLFVQGRFVTLEDAAILAAMEADPEGQLTNLSEEQPDAPVIIDEAQRSPKLALAIKKIVDRNRRKGQFVLTGSTSAVTSVPNGRKTYFFARVPKKPLWQSPTRQHASPGRCYAVEKATKRHSMARGVSTSKNAG